MLADVTSVHSTVAAVDPMELRWQGVCCTSINLHLNLDVGYVVAVVRATEKLIPKSE